MKRRTTIVSLLLMAGLLAAQATAAELSKTGAAATIENPYVGPPAAIRNMYHPARFPDLYVVTQPNCLFTSRSEYEKIKLGIKPSSVDGHGSLWNYDTDVPIIFYGAGIKKGILAGKADLIDIAPTLAYLSGVQRPSAAKGRILNEIIKPEVATWTSNQRPKVLALFSLDQGRNDYFSVFEKALHFMKSTVIANGASYVQGEISYAKTETAVGHTTVGTGTIPGVHGVVGNNIILPEGTYPLAVDDGNGGSNLGHGDMNPKNILVASLADELDRRYNNRSIIISSGSYARAAVGMAGHGAYYKDGDYTYAGADKDIVFALNMYSGVPYTNTDFFSLPPYLQVGLNPDVSAKNWLRKYYGLDIEKTSWTQSLTIADDSPFSVTKKRIGTPAATFPWGEPFEFSHNLVTPKTAEPTPLQSFQEYQAGITSLTNKYVETSRSPFFDMWNVDLNLLTMEREGVGKDVVPDFVFFHLKSLDVIGHTYGVYSGEVYNYLAHADYMIKKVITWLDKNVGKGNYTAAFFADHGGTNVITNGQWIVNEDVIAALETRFGIGIVKRMANDQFWLSPEVMTAVGTNPAEVAAWMETNLPWVFKAYTREAVLQTAGWTAQP